MVRHDYTGARNGKLLVIEYAGKAADGHSVWLCKCDCGNYTKVSSNNLRKNGGTISCGCSNQKISKERIGKKFGKLTALEKIGTKGHRAQWKFLCDCGRVIEFDGSTVFTGRKTSCGCDAEPRHFYGNCGHKTHGESGTRLYRIWYDMKRRCSQPQNKYFKNYGGRGISVCKEWMEAYEPFSKWAHENGYRDDLTLDRIDNNLGYSPSNCRWSDVLTQANNRSNNHLIEFKGETLSMADTARKYGINYNTLRSRINKGQNASDVVQSLIGGTHG